MTKEKDKDHPATPRREFNPYSTKSSYRFKEDIKTGLTYLCSLCRKAFPKKYNAERHLRTCNSSGEGEMIVVREPITGNVSQNLGTGNSFFRESPFVGLMNSTSDIDMDTGSFSKRPLFGFGDHSDDPTLDNGFSIESSSTGVLNRNEYMTMDNGISSNVPSSEPIHFSNEESDDEEENIQGGNTGAFFLNTIAPLMDILEHGDENSVDNTADDVMETIANAYPADPFRNVLDFVLIAFFNGSKMNLSMAKIKSIMVMIRLLFKLKEKDNALQLP
ncbi:hypothetical protein BD560DRAFT_429421 [Blakeslea trispora]|nr:hypothetical protein BD560DRAFT_429421 [Blakeslea trispora]